MMAEGVHAISGMLHSPCQAVEGMDSKDKSNAAAPDGVRKEFNFWTDQEVWFLLDAYEEKWNQLDRGNVKSKHWEEIATRLSGHSTGLWSPKTPTQCKNKIEDMKKKYRAEKSTRSGGSHSKWMFFQRMESMLRNGFKGGAGMPGGMDNGEHASQAVLDIDSYGNCSQLDSLQQFRRMSEKEMHEGGTGNEEEDTSFTTSHHARKENVGGGSGHLTSLLNFARAREDLPGSPGVKRRKVVGGGGGSVNEMVSVIKSFGESLLRIEEAQIQLQREVARLTAEADIKRMEMEMKRTEMMLNTQLQIAKLFSSKPRKKKVVKKSVENGGVHEGQ